MSYGSDEASVKGGSNNIQLKQSHAAFQDAVNAGISLFASVDNGTAGGASYPASDPLVTGVGGTNLTTTDTGSYTGETVWGDFANCPLGCPFGPLGATGGAPSALFDTPAYQAGVTGYDTRTTSDVSWNASVYTSVLVYVGFNANPADNGFYFYGGTSAGSPQWAAATALLDAHFGTSLGELNPALYGLLGIVRRTRPRSTTSRAATTPPRRRPGTTRRPATTCPPGSARPTWQGSHPPSSRSCP